MQTRPEGKSKLSNNSYQTPSPNKRNSRVLEHLSQIPRIIDRDEMSVAFAEDTDTVIVYLVDDGWTESGDYVYSAGGHVGVEMKARGCYNVLALEIGLETKSGWVEIVNATVGYASVVWCE